MILLGVNIDHCATLRQARYRQAGLTTGGNVEPDPVTFAMLCERAGADCITVHLREDQRHIQERDVWRLRESCATRLNLEMACTPAMTEFALRLKPDSVCLVPESREEVTTEGGLDVVKQRKKVQRVTDAMNAARINTSLFIDADEHQIALAAKIGAPFTRSWRNLTAASTNLAVRALRGEAAYPGLRRRANSVMAGVQAISRLSRVAQLSRRRQTSRSWIWR